MTTREHACGSVETYLYEEGGTRHNFGSGPTENRLLLPCRMIHK